MASKLYQRYISLKIEDNDAYYLFKSGIFYLFISEDAQVMSKMLDLKLSNLNPYIKKCGFPVNAAERYFKKIDELGIKVKVIDLSKMTISTEMNKYLNVQQIMEIIDDFLKVNVEELSISQAFDLLEDLQNKLRELSTDTF